MERIHRPGKRHIEKIDIINQHFFLLFPKTGLEKCLLQ